MISLDSRTRSADAVFSSEFHRNSFEDERTLGFLRSFLPRLAEPTHLHCNDCDKFKLVHEFKIDDRGRYSYSGTCSSCAGLCKHPECWNKVEQDKKYQRRYPGKTKEFCSLQCGGRYYNLIHAAPTVTKRCAYHPCQAEFETRLNSDERNHCSERCGKLSSTQHNLMNESLPRAHSILNFTSSYGIECVLEFAFPGFDKFYDMALPDFHILIEFDGPNHREKREKQNDLAKERYAEQQGWTVFRIEIEPKQSYPLVEFINVIQVIQMFLLIQHFGSAEFKMAA